jgi:hypothetical protein
MSMAMPDPDGRLATRTSKTVVVELSALHWPPGQVRAITQNVSARGARVVSQRRWYPGDRVGLRSLEDGVSAQGRVVYCVRAEKGKFAIGLELLAPVDKWGNPQ